MNDSLRLDDDRQVWKSKSMRLYHSVKGGISLKGDGACKLSFYASFLDRYSPITTR